GEDARVAAVGPVGDASRRTGPRGRLAFVVRWRVEPDDFARHRVERDDDADAAAHVEQAVDHDRRVLPVRRSLRVRKHRLELGRHGRLAPGDAYVLYRVLADLIEGRVLRARFVAGVGGPVVILGVFSGRATAERPT